MDAILCNSRCKNVPYNANHNYNNHQQSIISFDPKNHTKYWTGHTEHDDIEKMSYMRTLLPDTIEPFESESDSLLITCFLINNTWINLIPMNDWLDKQYIEDCIKTISDTLTFNMLTETISTNHPMIFESYSLVKHCNMTSIPRKLIKNK